MQHKVKINDKGKAVANIFDGDDDDGWDANFTDRAGALNYVGVHTYAILQ